jgi:hypothetical protein
MEPEQQEQVNPDYPRVMYRGEADLSSGEGVGAEEHLVVHNDQEKAEAIEDGYRMELSPKVEPKKKHNKKDE